MQSIHNIFSSVLFCVSEREMNQLMDELFQFYEEMADWEDEGNKTVKTAMNKTKYVH